MALYGNTDSNANKTKVEGTRGNGPASASGDMTVVFVDATEADLAENKARGVSGPGWWNFHTYTQGSVTRTKAECLAVISNPDTNANETQADDAIAADFTIVIDSQPAAASVTAPAAAQFVVAASTTPAGGALTFQWAVSTDGGTNFTNLADGGVYSGATASTLDISDSSGLDTYQYRVVVSNTGASTSVTSDAATLTVA
jgi:hypothetical protein